MPPRLKTREGIDLAIYSLMIMPLKKSHIKGKISTQRAISRPTAKLVAEERLSWKSLVAQPLQPLPRKVKSSHEPPKPIKLHEYEEGQQVTKVTTPWLAGAF
jgi:hypothetical protein